jgi:hypothetical protein
VVAHGLAGRVRGLTVAEIQGSLEVKTWDTGAEGSIPSRLKAPVK